VEPESRDVFARYHRVERTRSVRAAFVAVSTLALGILGVGLIVSLAEPEPEQGRGPQSVTAPSPPPPVVVPDPAASPLADVLPAPPPADLGTTVEVPAVADGPWRIAVAATGYQAELDACQWVRMDLGVAPIVGAHRSCGGAIVLEMADLDVVEIAGQGLDGSYRVTAARDAHAGDAAASATEGLEADVILQTCYPGSDGRVRLVALIRVDSSDAAAAPAAAPAA